MSLRINDEAPNFTAQSTRGEINFHEWLGDSWGTTVDPELVEAARGVGMPERRVLLSLELPVSAPVTLAGIKIATVQVVSTATIGAILSSGGGFGRYIVDGFGQGPPGHAKVLGGAVLLAGLVLVIESIFALAERRLLPEGIRRLGRATDVVNAIGHG